MNPALDPTVGLGKPIPHEADDTGMVVRDYLMEEIYSDPIFNIRGELNMANVVDLARNIQTNGLISPITIQPYKHLTDAKVNYRIVAGHRRHAAFIYLDRKTIPAIVRKGMSNIQAIALNFVENINRQELNMLQEAIGIDRFVEAGLTIEEIARQINKGKEWVRIRRALLTMPEAIQQDAAAGWLTAAQLANVASFKTPENQLEAVKKIKAAKIRGDKRQPEVTAKKKDPTKMKRRSPEEVYDMIENLLNGLKPTYAANVGARALAWANGEISDIDLYRDMIEWAKQSGCTFTVPEDVKHFNF